MNRRTLFKALAAGAVICAIPFKWVKYKLYGDGVHDDTEALQAWFDGKNVYWENGDFVGRLITGKRFLFHKTIVIPSRWDNAFCGNTLEFDRDANSSDYALYWDSPISNRKITVVNQLSGLALKLV